MNHYIWIWLSGVKYYRIRVNKDSNTNIQLNLILVGPVEISQNKKNNSKSIFLYQQQQKKKRQPSFQVLRFI